MNQSGVEVSVPPDERPCSGCGDEPRRPGQRYGARCHAAANRASRARAAERVEEEIARRVAEQLAAESAAVGRHSRSSATAGGRR